MSRETEDLETHVSLCELRYRGIQDKFAVMEQKIDDIESNLKELRTDMDAGFADIKKMLTNAKDEKFKVMVGATATIIVGLLAMLGYVITHLASR